LEDRNNPSNRIQTGEFSFTEDYALADLYAWLEAHSGFTNHAAAARLPAPSMPSSNSTAK